MTRRFGFLLFCLLGACQPTESSDDQSVSILLLPDMATQARERVDASVTLAEERFNSARPSAISTDGGTRVTLIGIEFDEGLTVRIGNRLCNDIEFQSATRVVCTAPPNAVAGPTELELMWSDGHRERHLDVLSYFVPLGVSRVTPSRLSASRGGELMLSGQGFVEDMYVVIGGIRLPTQLVSEVEATLTVPRLRPGLYDLALNTPNQLAELPEALTMFAPLRVSRVEPAVGDASGGDTIQISGVGLLADSEVRFGNVRAGLVSARDDGTALEVTLPESNVLGLVDVSIENANGRTVQSDGFLYTGSSEQPWGVDGILPSRVAARTNSGFWIGGRGFNQTTEVLLDEQLLHACTLQTAFRIFCDTSGVSVGFHEVIVTDGLQRRSGPFALEVYNEPIFFSIEPARGSVAGGTLVTINGDGFDASARISFFEQNLDILTVRNERIEALTPPSAMGLVDLSIEQNDGITYSPDAFEYVNSGTSFGGVYGPSIARNLNVAVYDARTYQPVPNATVRAESTLTAEAWQSTTNENGQVVIADPELEGPLAVTAGHPDYTSSTIDRVIAQNTSLLLTPKIPPEGRESPQADSLVSLSGRVIGIDALEKPSEGGRVQLAVVEPTHPYPNGLFSLPTPTETSLLFEDGTFELFATPGQFGLVATVGLIPIDTLMAFQDGELNYWQLRRELEPRAMGYTPFLTGYPGDVIRDIEIVVDRLRPIVTEVNLDNPPGGVPDAPNHFLARAILDLGADGYFDLGVEQRSEDPRLLLSGLPQIADWPELHVRMRWEAEAFVMPDETPSVSRYSWSSVTTDEVFAQQVVGPFLPTTQVISPAFEATVAEPSLVQWIAHPGMVSNAVQEVPDLHYLSLSNQEGSLWTGWLPGAVDRVTLPLLSDPLRSQLSDDVNSYYLSIFSALAGPRFSFDDFGFGSLGNLRAYSWSFTRFADGELPQEEDAMP